MGIIKSLLGQTFGRLTVVSFSNTDNNRNAVWNCVCECGSDKTVMGAALRGGRTQSCGCLRKETTAARRRKHGLASCRTYKIWRGMWTRCTNPNSKSKTRYIDRGISVCDRWRKFENFFSDMGHAPEGLQIDRIDNDKGYSPENCRWATRIENVNNRECNVKLTYDGITKTVNEWARELKMSDRTLRSRLNQLGFTVEQALTTPVKRQLRTGI